MQSSTAVLGVETEPPRYNMRRTTSRPMLLEEHHTLHSPTRAPHSGRESPLNLKLVSDSHSSDLAKFMTAEPLPVSHPSPTFIGHNFMGELSYSPAKPVQAKAAFCTLSTALQETTPSRAASQPAAIWPGQTAAPSHRGTRVRAS